MDVVPVVGRMQMHQLVLVFALIERVHGVEQLRYRRESGVDFLLLRMTARTGGRKRQNDRVGCCCCCGGGGGDCFLRFCCRSSSSSSIQSRRRRLQLANAVPVPRENIANVEGAQKSVGNHGLRLLLLLRLLRKLGKAPADKGFHGGHPPFFVGCRRVFHQERVVGNLGRRLVGRLEDQSGSDAVSDQAQGKAPEIVQGVHHRNP
mmetsp:Transcript_18976/g.52935  ORF Transcript_18976/g.52935 Transcript_18976/m.52935 type:complete len:205 (+) Transcript_18976:359-973(+)